jgi:hypothetical protein
MTTLESLTEQNTEDRSTSSPEDSPANHSQRPESKKVKAMTDISFPKCFELLMRSDQLGSSLKTYVDSLVSRMGKFSPKFSHNWKAQVTRSHHVVFLLQPSKPRTKDSDCGSSVTLGLPTPQAVFDGERAGRKAMSDPKYFEKRRLKGRQTSLTEAIVMLPTPISSDNRDRGSWQDGAIQRRVEKGKSIELSMMMNQKPDGENLGLKLQPAFVEWMMGYPQNWTSLHEEPTNYSDVQEYRRIRKSLKSLYKELRSETETTA